MPQTFLEWVAGSNFAPSWVGDAPGAGIAIWLLFSHIVLGAAIIRAFTWRLLRIGTYASISFTVSYLFYHACRNGLYCFGVPMNTWRLMDHIFVLILFGNVGLHVLLFALSTRNARVFDMVLGYVLPFVAVASVLIWPFTAASGIAVVAFIVVAAVGRLIWWLACEPEVSDKQLRKQQRRCRMYPAVWLGVALVSGLAGLTLYFITDDSPHQNSQLDALLHGTWHILSGVALLALVEATAYQLTYQLEIKRQDA